MRTQGRRALCGVALTMKYMRWLPGDLAVLVLTGVIIVLIPFLSSIFRPGRDKNDVDGMVNDSYFISVSYKEAGDMSGEISSLKLYKDDVGKVWLEVYTCNGAGDDGITELYSLDQNAVYEFLALYDEKHMSKCGDLPRSEITALDAAVESVRIRFSDRQISFNSNEDFPEESIGAISSTYSLLKSFIPEKN